MFVSADSEQMPKSQLSFKLKIMLRLQVLKPDALDKLFRLQKQ